MTLRRGQTRSTNDNALMKPDDSIGKLDVVFVVSDARHRRSAPRLGSKDLTSPHTTLCVESSSGFVEEENIGLPGDALR